MHVPMVNWGMRTLTQLLYAQMIWDVNTDVDIFIDEYFTNWYQSQADNARKAYELIEEAWLMSAGWRAWFDQSILTQLQKWDGKRPEMPLKVNDHFKTPQGAIRSGRKSIKLMHQAFEIIKKMIKKEQVKALPAAGGNITAAVNPSEQRNMEKGNFCEMRLSEDRRLLIYGIDTMKIMTYLVEYHNAMYESKNEKAAKLWQDIERVADKMDSYFLPISYDWPGTGLNSPDALSRTQVREILARIRGI